MNKFSLPIKTKAAIWWIVIFSIGTILVFVWAVSTFDCSDEFWVICTGIAVVFFPVWILLWLPSILLPLKKRWCWITSIIVLGLEIVSSIATLVILSGRSFNVIGFIPAIMIYIVPFILILLDRKNYFEVIYQRELEKKAEQRHNGKAK